MVRKPFIAGSVFAFLFGLGAGAIRAGAETNGLGAVADRGQAQAGARLYADRCTGCHSAELGEGGHGPPLKGEFFRTYWGGQSARKLYGFIISTMPASDPGSLSQSDTLALVAFILRSNGYPAGDAPLSKPADLEAIELPGPS